MRPLDPADHLRRPWRVHELARAEGLSLHDVWEVDAELPPGATLEAWTRAFRREQLGGLARALFGLRRLLGRAFGWDRGGSGGFVPVYAEAEEQLQRIENRTVTGFLHLSLADRRPRLAVYVRPRGRFGRAYLAGIEPFRRLVIYPGLLAAGRRAARALAR